MSSDPSQYDHLLQAQNDSLRQELEELREDQMKLLYRINLHQRHFANLLVDKDDHTDVDKDDHTDDDN